MASTVLYIFLSSLHYMMDTYGKSLVAFASCADANTPYVKITKQ